MSENKKVEENKIDSLTVMKTSGSILYCKCDDCGEIVKVKKLENGFYYEHLCGKCYSQDLTNKQYHNLTVKSHAYDVVRHNYICGSEHVHRLTFWECECSCGNRVIACGNDLTHGHPQSCGVCGVPDLIDKRVGILTVTERLEDSYKRMHLGTRYVSRWKCKCDCGNTVIMSADYSLPSAPHFGIDGIREYPSLSLSCGCLKTADLKDKKFGMLSVIEKCDDVRKYEQCIQDDYMHFYDSYDGLMSCAEDIVKVAIFDEIKNDWWLLQCDCGKKMIRHRCHILHPPCGHIFSCGCTKWVQVDLTDSRSGMLTVVKRVPDFISEKNNRHDRWLCKCDCGGERIVLGSEIRKKSVTSCGCLTLSNLEYWMRESLLDYGYTFKQQIKFSDLFGTNNGQMSYDFGIYDNENLICLIECQGRQHYESIEYFGGEEQFNKQLQHDEMKRQYAFEELHVPLVEIPYDVKESQIKSMLCKGGLIWEYIDCYSAAIYGMGFDVKGNISKKRNADRARRIRKK